MPPITCPRCRSRMQPTVREGVDLDVCTSCLGVWFDRGEVDKVFHRLAATDPADLPSTWDPPELDTMYGARVLARH